MKIQVKNEKQIGIPRRRTIGLLIYKLQKGTSKKNSRVNGTRVV
jgi:hypothetical protein